MKKDEIEILINKYLDGDTTNAEEQTLRRYFKTTKDKIPDEWLVYKALFDYEQEQAQTTIRHHVTGHHAWIYITSIAASVAILLTLSLSLPRQNRNYAVIEGKTTTDKHVINKEAEEALSMVSTNDEETFCALDEMK